MFQQKRETINTYEGLHFSVKLRAVQVQPLEVFCKKGDFKNFANSAGKHLCQSLFFNKVAGASCNFIKNETLQNQASRGVL